MLLPYSMNDISQKPLIPVTTPFIRPPTGADFRAPFMRGAKVQTGKEVGD